MFLHFSRIYLPFLLLTVVFSALLRSGARDDLVHQRFTDILLIIVASAVVHIIYLVSRRLPDYSLLMFTVSSGTALRSTRLLKRRE